MNSKVNELMILVENHPNLPIVPLVDSDIVLNDNQRCPGSIGDVSVGEYAVYNDRVFLDRLSFTRSYFKSNQDWLCFNFGYNPEINKQSVHAGRYTAEEFAKNEEALANVNSALQMAAEAYFKKAIIVDIDCVRE